MTWPRRRSSATEVQLKRENDALARKLLRANATLQLKTRYVQSLEYLLHERSERIDKLASLVDQLREANKRLDAEADRWATRYAEAARPQAEQSAA